jgi:hypothetical protein
VFSILKTQSPKYLFDLLSPHRSTRTLRSSTMELLNCPRENTVMGSRAFSHFAPLLWNSLPHDIRVSSTQESFCAQLKRQLTQS